MMRTVLCALGLLGAVLAQPASACGHCVEDKIAAVYDFAVVSGAQTAHRHVAFVAIDGSFVNDAATQRKITDMVRATKGVDGASVRISLDLAAISFAYDPKRASFAAIHRAVEKQMAPHGLRLTEMKILDESAPWPAMVKR